MQTLVAVVNAVDTAGTIVPLTIPAGSRRFRIDEVRIRKTAGTAVNTEAILSTDTVSATPGTVDATHEIVSYEDNLQTNPVNDDNEGAGFAHRGEDSAGELRLHIVPDLGTDNDYQIEILVGRRF